MLKMTAARRTVSRLTALTMALVITGLLGGCAGLTPTWDPTDLFDFLDSKKRAPGERKPVFPEGVPGVAQGVPKEMIRGSAEARAAETQATAAAEPPPPPQPAAPPARRSRTAAKQPPQQSQVEIAPDDVNVGEEPPPPPPRRQAQRPQRAAPPPQQQVEPQQQANPFPAPLPR